MNFMMKMWQDDLFSSTSMNSVLSSWSFKLQTQLIWHSLLGVISFKVYDFDSLASHLAVNNQHLTFLFVFIEFDANVNIHNIRLAFLLTPYQLSLISSCFIVFTVNLISFEIPCWSTNGFFCLNFAKLLYI